MESLLDNHIDEIFNFDQYLNNTALITKNEQVTYKELKILFEDISLHISQNSLVFLLASNNIESVASYLAILNSNATCALINATNKDHLFNLIKQYNPHYIIVQSDQIDLFNDYTFIYKFKNFVLLKVNTKPNYSINKNLSLLLTTSGSTGSPKFVRLSFENIKSNTNSISEYLNIKHDDRVITTLPFYYSYGLSLINTHLHCGASIVLTEDSIVSKEFWELFKEYKVNNFAGVPYTYEILKKLNIQRKDLSQLRYITQAGGKLNHKLVEEFHNIAQDNNFDFYVMYGQTEATARMSYLPLKHIKEHSNSIGIAIPYGKFKLLDDNKKEILTPHTVGELVYEGQNVSLGYATSYKDLQLENENQGLLHTGDLAKFDENNLYYVVGRKKRFCKIFGNRVNLDELEQMIKSHGYEAICIGDDDKVYIFSENDFDYKSLVKILAQETSIHQSVFKTKIIDSIPRNESGKIQYSKLEELKG